MKKIFSSLLAWQEVGLKTALAVVTKTWGSAPRRVGSLMAIASDGRFEGSVSGGCVEGTVIAEANVLAGSGGSKLLKFTVSSEQAWEVGLACGGQIEIMIVGFAGDIAQACSCILEALAHRNSGTISLALGEGALAFSPGDPTALSIGDHSLTLPVEPKRQLFIIGAVHIAEYLCVMADAAGYAVTIIDPRAAFSESRNFGACDLITDWPDEFLKGNCPDSRTAVVTLTHDPKIDDAALVPALASDAFYIGSLGSRKTHAARLARLREADLGGDTLARIHGPVGLNIGAANPAEIAVSILAEMTQTLRQADGI